MSTAPTQTQTFGALLRTYRVAAGMTQEELAAHAQLSPRAIAALERGERLRPRDVTLRLLAEALRLTDAESAALTRAARTPKQAQSAPWPQTLPLIGRQRELAQLDRFLAGTMRHVLVIEGEPGIGKTHLLREMAAQAERRGWHVIAGSCHPSGSQEPYAPLPEALAADLRRRSAAQRRAAVRDCRWLVHVLPELTDLAGIQPPTWSLPPEQERRLMFSSVAHYLANITGAAGTLLVLDDVQWAGADALALIDSLVSAEPEVPLRLAIALRNTDAPQAEALPGLLAQSARAGMLTHLALGPLAPADAEALLDAALDGAGDATLRDNALRRAEGVPLFLLSFARAIRDGALSESGVAAVQWDIAAMIRQRLAALPPGTQEVAQIAAIAGTPVSRELLYGATAANGADGEGRVADLDALEGAGLLAPEGASAYRFTHELVRKVIAGDLSSARREALHGRIARALEMSGRSPSPRLLAYHFSHSRDRARAIPYFERAGDQAAARHAYTEAAEQYSACLGLLDDPGQRRVAATVREKLAEAQLAQAHYAEALTALGDAAEAHLALGDRDGHARVAARIGWAHALRGTPDEGTAIIQRILATPNADALPPRTLAVVYVADAQLHYTAGRHAEQVEAATRAAELARQADDPALLAQAEMRRGNALLMLGRLDEGARVMAEAIPLAEAAGDLWSLAHALNNIGVVYESRGQFSRTRDYTEQALAVARTLGDPTVVAFMQYREGMNAFYMGVWERAWTSFEAAAERVRGIGPSWVSAYPPLGLGTLQLARGQIEPAARHLETALDAARRRGDQQALLHAHSALAEWELLDGRAEAAYARLAPLLDRFDRHGDVAILLPLLAWARAALGERTAAYELLSRGARVAEAESNAFDRVDLLRVEGWLAAKDGQRGRAERAFQRARDLCRAMPYPYGEAKVLYMAGLASLYLRMPDRASDHQRAAGEICARLGERLYAEHAARALGAVDR